MQKRAFLVSRIVLHTGHGERPRRGGELGQKLRIIFFPSFFFLRFALETTKEREHAGGPLDPCKECLQPSHHL